MMLVPASPSRLHNPPRAPCDLAAEAELKSATARAASDANAALLNRCVVLAQQVFEALRDHQHPERGI
jgi:hypothetical protein